MPVYWLTTDEVRRATSLRSTDILESLDTDIATRDLGCRSWSFVYELRLTQSIRAAIGTWLIDENRELVQKYFHMAGEAGFALMSLEDESEIIKMVYLAAKFWYLRKKKDGKWVHGRKAVDEMLAKAVPNMNDLFEGQIPDFESGKPIVFMNSYVKLQEYSVPAMEAALASGDMDLAKKVAEVAGTLGDFDFQKVVAWYVRVLKYCNLGDQASARRSLAELAKTVQRVPYQQLGRCYEAVLDCDQSRTEIEFSAYLRWFAKKRKPEPSKYYDSDKREWVHQQLMPYEFLLSLPGLAFCNWAASRGVKLEVDEPFLPRELLAY